MSAKQKSKQKSKYTASPEELDTSVLFSGIAVLTFRTAASVLIISAAMSPTFDFLGWMSCVVCVAAAAFGIVSLLRHGMIPRGCECVPVCAAATRGCLTCPCVPWSIGLFGLLAIFEVSILLSAETSGLPIPLVLLDLLGALLAAVFSVFWLCVIGTQRGRICCSM